MGFFAHYRQLALGAAALCFALALPYHLAAEYLILFAWRMHAARRRGPEAVEAFLAKERQRLRRLENEAAVSSEQGRPEALDFREETLLRRAALVATERGLGGR